MSPYQAPGAYLPHEAPMLLLDEVVMVTEEQATCRVTVDRQGILAPFLNEQGALPAWFAIELIAQTVGVWAGWHRQQRGEDAIALGMLLGARDLHSCQGDFPPGTTLEIQISLLMQDTHFGSFEARILDRDELLASGRINTYQPAPHELQQLFTQEEPI